MGKVIMKICLKMEQKLDLNQKRNLLNCLNEKFLNAEITTTLLHPLKSPHLQ